MATTIRSSELDFNEIKNSLKEYFQKQAEFSDYNFEASGLSNLLDVLAYNTHQNALLANFALNESFLSTAQLRSSLVGHAGSLGYTVSSRTASTAIVQMYVTDLTGPSSKTMPAGTAFSATVDNKSYLFKTREALTASNDGSNRFYFSLNDNINVPLYEGTSKQRNYIAGAASENDTYVIPVSNLDLDTIVVRVYDDTSTSYYDVYTNILEATNITSQSKIYAIKETPNGFYELSFGNGVITNQIPNAGNRVQVIYDVVAGPEANGASTFTPESQLDGLTITVTTVSSSDGGALKEGIESIRKNAPYLYASQNRMVTAEDYSALILRNYSSLINDIKSWGGEENNPPKYGTVYVSIDFSTQDSVLQETAKGNIRNLAKNLSVASFDIEFVEPNQTFIEIDTVFQFNPNLTSSTQTAIESAVRSTMETHFETNLGEFDKSFRRSNLLTDIDETDASVLSSRATIRMQNRFTPESGRSNYTISFPTSIASPEEDYSVVTSSNFFFKGKVCSIKNRSNSSVIEVIDTAGNVVRDNVGSYDSTSGTIILSGFTVSLISGTFFKITALPANQATINPLRNNIINYDATASSARAVITNTV